MDLSEPLAATTLTDAAEMVLGEVGPLTATKLAINQKRGCRQHDDPRVLLVSSGDAFYGEPGDVWVSSH